MDTNFNMTEIIDGDIIVIKVQGELDALVAPKFKDKISKELENGMKKFVIDFRDLEHINSLAMGILRGKLKAVKGQNGDIKLSNLNEHIKDLFEMIGLDELFEIYDNVDEAVNSYK